MFHSAISTNLVIRVIENVANKYDIRIKEYHKDIATILISGIVYKDYKIIIAAETIRQINKILKKHNERYDIINALFAIDCISSIDKFGAVTIPLAFLLNKLTVNRDTISSKGTDVIRKKVLTNATSTLCISELLSHLGIPKAISVPLVNIIIELIYTDLDKEVSAMKQCNVAFKNQKMSSLKDILYQMQAEKIFLSTAILLVITNIGLKISTSLILVNVISELIEIIKVEYKLRNVKGFLD